jgi:hypothetical protein
MKKLLIGLIFFSFGCSSNQKDIRSIEFMCYNWDLKYPTESFKGKFYIQPKIYSILNLNGENQSYSCEFSPNKNEIYFNSKIDAKLVTDLVNSLSNVAAEQKEITLDSYSQGGCVESTPIVRLKVVFSNNEEKCYLPQLRKDNKTDLAMRKLFIALVNKIDMGSEKMKDTLSFATKKKAFIDLSMHMDTLNLPLPPLPKYNKIKFKK